MDRDQIITKLRNGRVELQRLGVRSLAVFGSSVRGDSEPGSDIDLAALYDDEIVKDLMDLGGVAAAIERCLGTDNFDLADESRLAPHVSQNFTREHVRIF